MNEYVRRMLQIDCETVSAYIVERLREYMEESGLSGGVLGLSGGIDSSVVAVLLAKATPNFFLLLMPSSSTPARDMEDAMAVVKMVGGEAKHAVIPIDGYVDALSKAVETNDKKIIGNIKARVRMTLLYAFAQKLGYMVVGTGDKSELMLGYFTKYGDGGVDILPIGDLYKTQVRQLGACLGLPESIIRKPPSPALWEGQTAEGELGVDYETIDSVLYLRYEEMRPPQEVAEMLGVDISIINRVDAMVRKSQHKRLPPEIFRLSGRAIGSDWRYPRRYWNIR
ncbi:NAD+ synthase [Thermoproteus tenax]|uniref:NH(3)-dependent NAD(+) synthetase n=1 Tax=Thermoproteus tenax (strain ATCC 35583 / DSM 2078 / JCM 9277 / NBRC 100435 / Kra 1) TaxID=768679 RepID=G4RNZ1_THETK|nr:NAD+ synthase [Thermoproteus tenax]CCC81285.1 NH(3)-dependent NAD+ synthetase [Thermoproteus tenax Kra 1]